MGATVRPALAHVQRDSINAMQALAAQLLPNPLSKQPAIPVAAIAAIARNATSMPNLPSNQPAELAPALTVNEINETPVPNAAEPNNVELTVSTTPSPDMTVFPNPTRSKTTLKVSGVTGPTNIYLTSSNGKLIEHRKVELAGTNNRANFNLTPPAAGMYFLTVQQPKFRKTIRLSKLD